MIGRIGPELSFQSYSGIRSVLFTILSLLYIQKFSRVHLHSRIIGTYIKFYTCLIIKKFCHSNQFPGIVEYKTVVQSSLVSDHTL